jgi:O-antigen ligase
VSFVLAILFSWFAFLSNPTEKLDRENPVTFSLIIGLLYILAPLLTSLATNNYQPTFLDEEYRSLIKMILFSPCLFLVIRSEENTNFIVKVIILFYSVLGIYFLYRYLVLNEVRAYDLRPKLNIRNGDANFLCTFFSMMIPIAMMKARSAFIKKAKIETILFVFASILLLLCTFFTQSRMGILATLIGLAYLFSRPIMTFSKVYLVGLMIIIISTLAFVNTDKIIHRFREINDKSNTDRYLTWKNAGLIFIEAPLLGVGIHNAKYYFYKNTGYPDFQTDAKQLDVHNTFLKVLSELGIVGFLFFALFFLWPWIIVIRLKTPERFFLISSLVILTFSIQTIGIPYKDLFILHLVFVSATACFYKNYSAPPTEELVSKYSL